MKRARTLPEIVDMHRRGRITRRRAVRLLRALGRRIVDETPGTSEYDRRNIDHFLDVVVAQNPVEQWAAALQFWKRSVQLDAPWVRWVDPQELN